MCACVRAYVRVCVRASISKQTRACVVYMLLNSRTKFISWNFYTFCAFSGRLVPSLELELENFILQGITVTSSQEKVLQLILAMLLMSKREREGGGRGQGHRGRDRQTDRQTQRARSRLCLC